MGRFIKWGLTIIAGLGIGIWYAKNENKYNVLNSIIILSASVIIAAYVIAFIYSVYVLRISKNVKEVEKYLGKLKKRPYFAVLIDVLNGQFEEASNQLDRIKNRQRRAALEAVLHIESNNIDEARKATAQILNPTVRNVNYAIIAMLENDWSTFEKMKSKIKNKKFRYPLEADAFFRKGDLEQAKAIGDLAISTASGLHRYALIKSLERQQRNPNRVSYF